MPASLSTLRSEVRERADMANSQFVSDAALTTFIQKSYRKLYDLLVSKFQDYFLNDPVEFTISSGNTYDLPSGFYKLAGVDEYDGQWRALDPFNFNERNDQRRRKAYRLLGSKLHITPADDAAGTYRQWSVPECPVLSSDDDELDVHCDRWSEFIVLDAAIKCLVKEESDPTALMAELKELRLDIETAASNRDVGRPGRIEDVDRDDYADLDRRAF